LKAEKNVKYVFSNTANDESQRTLNISGLFSTIKM